MADYSIALFEKNKIATHAAIIKILATKLYTHGEWILDREMRAKITEALIIFNREADKNCGTTLMKGLQ